MCIPLSFPAARSAVRFNDNGFMAATDEGIAAMNRVPHSCSISLPLLVSISRKCAAGSAMVILDREQRGGHTPIELKVIIIFN